MLKKQPQLEGYDEVITRLRDGDLFMKKLLLFAGLIVLLVCMAGCQNSHVQKNLSYETEQSLDDADSDNNPVIDASYASGFHDDVSSESGEDRDTIGANDGNIGSSSSDPMIKEDNKEQVVDTYEIRHEKSSNTYTIFLKKGSVNNSSIIQVLDSDMNELQHLLLDNPVIAERIDFLDANCDGYTDIAVYIGGTLNEAWDLYVWDEDSRMFVKVFYEGFEMLSFYEIYDDHVVNWVRDYNHSIKQTLVWEGNTLIKQSENRYDTEE